ncbi:hypothetical protein M0657_010774 [Pyricularia oryzae]|nr:hypothetical protein M9X92_010801 [Pyricularia oryzae]KAI7911785.1 hypothetical protein M0657_010774 [Pyricularia oryzae]
MAAPQQEETRLCGDLTSFVALKEDVFGARNAAGRHRPWRAAAPSLQAAVRATFPPVLPRIRAPLSALILMRSLFFSY